MYSIATYPTSLVLGDNSGTGLKALSYGYRAKHAVFLALYEYVIVFLELFLSNWGESMLLLATVVLSVQATRDKCSGFVFHRGGNVCSMQLVVRYFKNKYSSFFR